MRENQQLKAVPEITNNFDKLYSRGTFIAVHKTDNELTVGFSELLINQFQSEPGEGKASNPLGFWSKLRQPQFQSGIPFNQTISLEWKIYCQNK